MVVRISKIRTRQTHPDKEFWSRVLECPDGLVHVVTMPSEVWRAFDDLTVNYDGFYDHLMDLAKIFLKIPECEYSLADLFYYHITSKLLLIEAMESAPDVRYRLLFNACASPF